MESVDRAHDREQREALAAAIERHTKEIVDRWLKRVRVDAAAENVPLTDLQDGVTDYLSRQADLLRSDDTLDKTPAHTWTDVARAHALNRVRLGFDVTQLFHELQMLRKITIDVLREHDVVSERGTQVERISQLSEAAINASIASYVAFRDFTARRTEAEHIGFLTHELRNPLSAAAMAASQLRRPDLNPEQMRLFAILDRSLDRLRRLIDEAMLTERLQAGEVESRPVDTTLGQLFGDSIDLFRSTANAKGLELDISFDPATHVRADRMLTMSALENLLDNAIKYTDQGEVSFAVDENSDEVVFHVRDSCAGLSEQELRVIFEPFRRVHPKRPGSGLGLAIARRAVEAQGGAIHAESVIGVGCHFWFTLPKTHH